MNTRFSALLLLLSFSLLVVSCKKDDDPSASDISHAVYVGGWANPSDNTTNGAFYGRIWNNGSEQQFGTADESRVMDLAKRGSDLYAAGYSGYYPAAAYWKNGTLTVLPDDVNGNPVECANAICLYGTDVYIAGGPFYGPGTGTLWVNGVAVPLIGCADAKDVTVSDGDVYVAGTTAGSFVPVAAYWKNGSATVVGDYSSFSESRAVSIAVAGNDVYVVGDDQGSASFWKNGQLQYLPGLGSNSEGVAVATSGNDVYVLVLEDDPTGNYVVGGVYKNGSRIQTLNGYPTALAVKDGVVYVSGCFSDDNLPYNYSGYWKNGVRYLTTDGRVCSNIASSIFVE
jgi:hypothetical protein